MLYETLDDSFSINNKSCQKERHGITSSVLSLSLSSSLTHTHKFKMATCSGGQTGSSPLSLSAFPYPLSSCNLVTGLRPSFTDGGLYSAMNLIAGKQSFYVTEGGGYADKAI